MYCPALLLLFLLLTSGFQIIPITWIMAGLPGVKSSDLAIVFVFVLSWFHRKSVVKIVREHPIFKWLLYVLGFVVLDALYSCIVLNYSVVNVLQVFRLYLILLSFLFFFVVPRVDLKRVFHLIAVITLIQSVLFLFQIVYGHTILLSDTGDEDVVTNMVEGSQYVRFYNLPAFLLPTLFYFLFVFKFKFKIIKTVVLVILLLTAIGPMHRSLIFGVLIVLSFYFLLKQSSLKRVVYVCILGICIYSLSFVDVLNKRINGGLTDISASFSIILNSNDINGKENSFMFRVGHLLERADYVISSPERWVFGIGLISDNATYADRLPFIIGNVSTVTGKRKLIDTSDLVWSPLVLNLGIVGTILYTVLFWKLMMFFFKGIEVDSYNIVGFLWILIAFVLSMAGGDMLGSSFRLLISMVAVIVCKNRKNADNLGNKRPVHLQIGNKMGSNFMEVYVGS